MFSEIIKNNILNTLLVERCEENSIEAEICSNLTYKDDYLVIKVDNYYNRGFKVTGFKKTPASVDCLILVKCNEKGKRKKIRSNIYDMHLIELKNIKNKQYFKLENIQEKFNTTIEDFLNIKFKDIFNNFQLRSFNCYFISDPHNIKRRYKGKNITQNKYNQIIKLEGLKVKSLLLIKPLKYRNKFSTIKPRLPNLEINAC